MSKPHSELLARRFHEAYERLAPAYGYTTRPDSAVPWESVPLMNKRLMVATIEEACADLFEQLETLQAAVALFLSDHRESAFRNETDSDTEFVLRGELRGLAAALNPASEHADKCPCYECFRKRAPVPASSPPYPMPYGTGGNLSEQFPASEPEAT